MGDERTARFLLHFHNREILGAYGATHKPEKFLLGSSLTLTRYALLASSGPLLVMPKFAFEVPYFQRYLWNIRPVVSAGLIHYVSDNPDFGFEVEDKQRQYSGQQHLFPSYFNPSRVDTSLKLLDELVWTQRKARSATRAIEQAWKNDLEDEEAGVLTKIALELSENHGSVSKLLRVLENVPVDLGGKAFVLGFVREILPMRFTGQQLTAMNFLINGAYLALFLEAEDASILVDTMLGELDCGLRPEERLRDKLISFSRLRSFAWKLGLQAAIEKHLSWSDLVELREDLIFRWFFRLGVLEASGDLTATQLFDQALRELGAHGLIRHDVPYTLNGTRQYLHGLWNALERVPGIGRSISQYEFAFASRDWMQRRLRERERSEQDRSDDSQFVLQIAPKATVHQGEPMKPTIGLITFREDEFTSLLARFQDRHHHTASRLYEVARFTHHDDETEGVAVLVRTVEQGSGAASDATRDMIADFDPDLIIGVGIGGGVPASEYTLGDVLVATSVQDLRVRAVLQGGHQEYASTGARAHKAISTFLAQLPALQKDLGNWNSEESIRTRRPVIAPGVLTDSDLYGSEEWIRAVRQSLQQHFALPSARSRPTVSAGAIASSDTLIKDADYVEATKTYLRQVLGFEMEAAGIFQAAERAHKQYPVLIVRGISDIVGLKRDPSWTSYACESAASFVYQLITSGLLSRYLHSVGQ
jgi:nucleoside phosphorylase